MSYLNRLYEQTKNTLAYKRKAARAAVTADLRILIANANKSQKEVAERIGISPAALSAKLSGDKNLTLDSIVDIADAVGAAVDVVFRATESKRAYQPWEAEAESARKLDRAAALLVAVEAMHEAYMNAVNASPATLRAANSCANDERFEKFAKRPRGTAEHRTAGDSWAREAFA